MNVHYVAQEKGGVSEISLAPHTKSRSRFTLVDGALILGFMAAFVGLVFLLSK
jgi:hypothetical protein